MLESKKEVDFKKLLDYCKAKDIHFDYYEDGEKGKFTYGYGIRGVFKRRPYIFVDPDHIRIDNGKGILCFLAHELGHHFFRGASENDTCPITDRHRWQCFAQEISASLAGLEIIRKCGYSTGDEDKFKIRLMDCACRQCDECLNDPDCLRAFKNGFSIAIGNVTIDISVVKSENGIEINTATTRITRSAPLQTIDKNTFLSKI